MNVSLSNLSANLLHISMAVSETAQNVPLTQEEIRKKFVPSLWGNRLYGQGITKIILELFYWIVEKYISPNWRQVRFDSVMRQTYEAFQYQTNEIKTALENRDTNKITDWSNWMHPVLKKHVWPHVEKVKACFESFVDQESATKVIWEQAYKWDNEATREQKIIDLEDTSLTPFPSEILNRVLDQKSKPEDEATLKTWIEVLNRSATKPWWQRVFSPGGAVKVRQLDKALRACVEKFATSETTQPNAKVLSEQITDMLTRLEFTLSKFQCKVFGLPDDKHLSYRQQPASGEYTYVDGEETKTLKTQDPFEIKKAEGTTDLAYNITDIPGMIVVFGPNRAILRIEEYKYQSNPDRLLPKAETILLHPTGTFKLSKKLGASLSEYKWKTNSEVLDPSDKNAARAVVNMIKTMLEKKRTLYELPLDRLHLDASGKSLMVYEELPPTYVMDNDGREYLFNLHVIIKFLFALGNKFVYRHVMKETKLDQVPAYHYFSLILENALKLSGKKDFLDIGNSSDPFDGARAEQFDKEAAAMLASCSQEIATRFECDISTQAFQNALGASIKACYHEDLSMGRFWPTFQSDVIRHFSSTWIASQQIPLKQTEFEKQKRLCLEEYRKIAQDLSKSPNINELINQFGIFATVQRKEVEAGITSILEAKLQ